MPRSPFARCVLGTSVLFACSAAPAGDSLHDLDVGLFVVDGKITTGEIISSEIIDRRVFTAEVQLFFGFPFTADPGFDSATGTFPPFSVNQLNILDALRVWEDGHFENLATMEQGDETVPVTMEISFGSSTVHSPEEPDTLVPGPAFAVTSLGDMHVHPNHVLPQNVPDGIYLLKFEMTSNAGLEATEPFWFIYDWNADPADVAAAQQWVVDNLIDGVTIVGDLNGDNVVDGADLAILLSQWGTDGEADLNDDGAVDGADLAILLANWG